MAGPLSAPSPATSGLWHRLQILLLRDGVELSSLTHVAQPHSISLEIISIC